MIVKTPHEPPLHLRMISANTNTLIDELLDRRREYHAYFERNATTGDRPFGDVDYVLVWHLIARLGIKSLQVDDAGVMELFRAAQPVEGSTTLQISLAAEYDRAAPAGALLLFNAHVRPADDWLADSTSENSLALCYGLTGTLDGSLAQSLQAVLHGGADVVFLPLFATAPPLWRAACLLIAARSRLVQLNGIATELTSTFSGDDLDALHLAEENLRLRATIGRLSTADTNHGELVHLKSTIATLEAQVVALRRTALAQEESIAALLMPAGGQRSPVGNNGHSHGTAR
jgi:hypothetical protein